MTTPYYRNPWPGGHEIYNFGRPFLGYHYYILSLSDLFLEVDKKILMKYINFTFFSPKPPPLWVVGHEIYNFMSLFLCMLHTKLSKDWPSSS